MTAPINMTLYRLLTKLGASETDAEDAARFDASELPTKADVVALKTDLLELETRLQRFLLQTLVWMTGIFAAIVAIIVGLFRVLGTS